MIGDENAKQDADFIYHGGETNYHLEKLVQKIDMIANEELYVLKQYELEKYWHFTFNESETLEDSIRKFHNALNLYCSFCERWEKKHNGEVALAERVQKIYALPKIREFAENLRKELK